jgi:hypothetical protein
MILIEISDELEAKRKREAVKAALEQGLVRVKSIGEWPMAPTIEARHEAWKYVLKLHGGEWVLVFCNPPRNIGVVNGNACRPRGGLVITDLDVIDYLNHRLALQKEAMERWLKESTE